MIKYKVAIIEDAKIEYDLVKEKVLKTPELDLIEEINLTTESYFQDFCKLILNTPIDIVFVDWELEFKDRESSIRKIFEWLVNNKYIFQDKYWVFYTNKYMKMPGYVRRHFFNNPNCYEMTGKDEITGIEETYRTENDKILENHLLVKENLFRRAILTGKKYLESIRVPETINSLEGEERSQVSIRFTRVIDLDEKPGTEASGLVRFCIKRFVCYAFNDDNGIFIYFDSTTHILKFTLVKVTQSNSHVRIELQGFPKVKSLIYNPYFFDKDIVLTDDLRPYVYYRSPQLLKSYRFIGNSTTKSLYSNRDSIDRVLSVLIKHQVLPSIELP